MVQSTKISESSERSSLKHSNFRPPERKLRGTHLAPHDVEVLNIICVVFNDYLLIDQIIGLKCNSFAL